MTSPDVELLTDEQLLVATGIPSVPSLKKMVATKFILPMYVAIPGGGRERRWAPEQVLLAQIAVRIAEAMGGSLQGAAELASGIDPAWCARAVAGDICEGSRLAIGDRSELWLEVSRGRFVKPPARLGDMGLDDVSERYSSTIVVNLAREPKP